MQESMGYSERMALVAGMEFLILLFQGPDEEQCVSLLHQGASELASLCPADHPLGVPVQALVRVLPGSSGLDELCRELQSEYVRLFISNPEGVPAPLYASCHQEVSSTLMSSPAVEMQRRLEQAGLEPDLPGNEPSDHLCVELGYLTHLLVEGWRLSSIPGKDAEDVALPLPQAAIDFAREHMLPWVTRFTQSVANAGAHPVFVCSARLLQKAVAVAAEHRE